MRTKDGPRAIASDPYNCIDIDRPGNQSYGARRVYLLESWFKGKNAAQVDWGFEVDPTEVIPGMR